MALTFERASELISYDPQTGLFAWKVNRKGRGGIKAGDVAGYVCARDGYRLVMIDGKMYRQHRIAFLLMTGVHPVAEVDHINGIRHDNSWSNLRDVDHSANQQNRHCQTKKRKHADLPFGVELNSRGTSGRYRARVRVDGRQVSAGSFATPEEAGRAAIDARRVHYEGFVG